MGRGEKDAEGLMKKYKLKIEPDALADIQDITAWYELAQTNLGKRFQNTAIRQIIPIKLRNSPMKSSIIPKE